MQKAADHPPKNQKNKKKKSKNPPPNGGQQVNISVPRPPSTASTSSAKSHVRAAGAVPASTTTTNSGSRPPPATLQPSSVSTPKTGPPSVSNQKTGRPPPATLQPSSVSTQKTGPPSVSNQKTGPPPAGRPAKATAGRAPHKQNAQQKNAAFVDYLAADVGAYLQTCDARMPPVQMFRELMALMQRPDEVTWRMLEAVRHDLTHILSTRFPQALESGQWRIHPFGSAISTLSFRDSDFDVLIHLPPTDMADLKAIINGMVRTMRIHQTFYRIVPITGARVPIIKSVHRGTATACDFSFCSNFFSVQNTFVVRRLANCNPRIKPLTLLLKFWFRVHGYLGTGKFTSYCMFQLIVFYLQRLPEPVLPPLQHFQRTVPVHLVSGWNVAFDFDRPLPMSRNQDSLMALLVGFFRFYKPFVFEDVVICTLTARTYPRAGFEEATHAGQELYVRARQQQPPCEQLNVSRPLCVQDPFTLNINVGTCANATFVSFVQHLQSSSVVFAGDADAMQMSTTLSVANALLQLYGPQPVVKGNKRTQTFDVQPNAFDLLICARKFKHLPGVGAVDKDNPNGNRAVIRTIWKLCVRHFVRSMFVELGGARLVTHSRKQKKKKVQLEKQREQQQQKKKQESKADQSQTPFDAIQPPEPHRTQTPTKRDATGEAVHEENSSQQQTAATDVLPAKKLLAPFCQSFDVYLSRNVFDSNFVCDDKIDLQQERDLAQKRLQALEHLPVSVHFELVVWGDEVNDLHVTFQDDALPKKANATGHKTDASAPQTSDSIFAWFRSQHKSCLRKYFQALDHDKVKVHIDSAALPAANEPGHATTEGAMLKDEEDDTVVEIHDEGPSSESDDDE